MSQMAVKTEGTSGPTGAPAVVAAVHYQGDRWRLVILANRNGLTLEQAVSLDAAGQVLPVLKQHKVERLVRVAPMRETVARCNPIPAGVNGELASVLALMAEAQLPETIPAHRRTAGGVPEGEGQARAALLIGWKGEAPESLVDEEEIEESWTTPAAALAVLRQGKGQSAVYADPEEGAVSVLAFGPSKSLARVLVEDAPNSTAFVRTVSGVVGETCSAASVAVPQTALSASGVILAVDSGVIGAVRSVVSGVPEQRSWFEQYGLALGAALAAVSKDPIARSLTALRASAPVRRESPPERVANWLSHRKRAWGVVAASVALLLLGPWVIASARLMVLNAKAVGLGDKNRERLESARRSALYQQLEVSRWPMTKLLADVSAAIPVGVTTDSIRLSTDQGLSVQGSAENAELVNTMQANLNATKLLSNVKLNRVDSGGSGVQFDLTADVVNPHVKAAGLEDYAAKPLAVRLYGEGASNTALPRNTGSSSAGGGGSRESSASRDTRSASRPPERTERGGGGGGNGGGDRGSDRGASRPSEAPSRPAAAAPGEAPPPLTDAEIEKMDRTTAMREWANRRTYPQKNPAIDATTKSRLAEEARKLQEQMNKAGAAR
jgi:hypothetical protein